MIYNVLENRRTDILKMINWEIKKFKKVEVNKVGDSWKYNYIYVNKDVSQLWFFIVVICNVHVIVVKKIK